MGIPTVSDRVAQTVVKLHIEPILDPLFHPDSYGYRSGRSAKQAIAIIRQRCWQYDGIVEFDIMTAALPVRSVPTFIEQLVGCMISPSGFVCQAWHYYPCDASG